MRRWMRQAALMGLVGSLTGCATLFNPGGVTTLASPPSGWSGRVMEIGIWRMPRSAELYVNGVRVNLAGVRQAPSRLGDGYEMRVMIPQDVPVELRIVDGARTATTRVQAKLVKRWIYFNLLLGPAIPVGFIVDSRTKKWTYLHHNSFDATALLQRAGTRGE